MGGKDHARKEKAAQVAATTEGGYAQGQAKAEAAVEAAQAETAAMAAASQRMLSTTACELKASSSKLKRVRDSVANPRPWCRRPSTQAVRYVEEPHSLC